jgi:hypothetical protein
MRVAIAIALFGMAAIYIAAELINAQHPSLPWVKRRRARRLRWQWARRPAGMTTGETIVPAPPNPAPQP